MLAATVGGEPGSPEAVRIIDLYVVNGESVGSEKFEYKLRWLAAVREWLANELRQYPNLVVLGDFNIAPDDRDVYDPKRWREKILCSTPEREALRGLMDIGLQDSFRLFNEEPGHHSWWDYRLAAFQRGWGLRIDLVLISQALRQRCLAAGIDTTPRGWDSTQFTCLNRDSGGVIAAAYFAKFSGLPNAISFDMGGTIAKMGPDSRRGA